MTRKIRLLFFYKNIGKYALNALAGALQQYCPELNLGFVKTEQQLIQQLLNEHDADPTVVLWTFYSSQFDRTVEALLRVKRQTAGCGGIYHLAGGVHCSAMPESTLRAGFDYVACGEGEELIVQFTRAMMAGDLSTSIRGLCYIDDQQNFVYQGRAFVEQMDNYLPGSDQYKKFGPIEITRGCVYACKFCQTPYVNKARFRHRSADLCVEFAKIMYAHGLRDFRFITPTSLSYGAQQYEVNLDAIDELLGGMRRELGKDARLFFGSFPSELRPEHISDEALKLLKQYVNNDNLIIGAQSGSDALLSNCGRGHSVDHVRQASEVCLRNGFKPNIDFLFGLPGETLSDRMASLTLAEDLAAMGAKIHLHSFMALPGTPYARSQPSALESPTLDRLIKLCSSGKAYGQWQHQARTVTQSTKVDDK